MGYSNFLTFTVLTARSRVSSQSRTSPGFIPSCLAMNSGIVVLTDGDLLLALATIDFAPISTLSTYTLIYLSYL